MILGMAVMAQLIESDLQGTSSNGTVLIATREIGHNLSIETAYTCQ